MTINGHAMRAAMRAREGSSRRGHVRILMSNVFAVAALLLVHPAMKLF